MPSFTTFTQQLGKLLLCLLLTFTHNTAAQEKTTVIFETSMGNLTIELFSEEAPITTRNFLSYVDSGFYNDTIFHRIINNFVVQGGGLTADMQKKAVQPPIKNESNNGLRNKAYTLSMARLSSPNSATSQFFINLKHNRNLDYSSRPGYAVFGKVIQGQEIADKMATVATGFIEGRPDVPLTPIFIERAYRKTANTKTKK